MRKQTQRKWVEEQLKANGEISRNEALAHYVSRLAAIMKELQRDGWEYTSERKGGNHVYRLSKGRTEAPKQQYFVIDPVTGKRIQVV